METPWKDFHYGLRMLRRNYGLNVIAALSLALGIGATSAIFSVINAVMLRPLPYRDPDRIVMVYEHHLKSGRDRGRVAPNNFLGVSMMRHRRTFAWCSGTRGSRNSRVGRVLFFEVRNQFFDRDLRRPSSSCEKNLAHFS